MMPSPIRGEGEERQIGERDRRADMLGAHKEQNKEGKRRPERIHQRKGSCQGYQAPPSRCVESRA